MKKNLYYFFPTILDNTQIVEFKRCPVKWFYSYVLHLKPEESVHLHFGKCYAVGQEAVRTAFFFEKQSSDQALEVGLEALKVAWGDESYFGDNQIKNIETCKQLLVSYYEYYPLEEEIYVPLQLKWENQQQVAVEFSSTEIIGEHPDLNLNLYFTGRTDMCVHSPNFGDGKVFAFDDKTAGGYISPVSLQQWELASQFTGYNWLLQQAGFNAVGVVVSVAALKGKTPFQRVEFDRSPYMIDNWHRDMLYTVEQMKKFYLHMIQQKDRSKSVPSMATNAALGENCFSYFRPCWYLSACTDKKGEQVKFSGAEQHIWLPREQKRIELKVYLKTEMKADLSQFVWKEVDVMGVESLFC